jgi:hypothetical protein
MIKMNNSERKLTRKIPVSQPFAMEKERCREKRSPLPGMIEAQSA